jgi:hypothetical protein
MVDVNATFVNGAFCYVNFVLEIADCPFVSGMRMLAHGLFNLLIYLLLYSVLICGWWVRWKWGMAALVLVLSVFHFLSFLK